MDHGWIRERRSPAWLYGGGKERHGQRRNFAQLRVQFAVAWLSSDPARVSFGRTSARDKLAGEAQRRAAPASHGSECLLDPD